MTGRTARRAAAVAAAVIFVVLACDGRFYDLTDPFSSPFAANAVRKLESVIAFAFVGALATDSPLRGALLLAGLSAIIEVGQELTGSPESLRVHAFDMACGALGGFLGPLTVRSIARR